MVSTACKREDAVSQPIGLSNLGIIAAYLVLERRVSHAVQLAVEARLTLPEECRAEHDREVLYGHSILCLVLDHSVSRREKESRQRSLIVRWTPSTD